MEVVFSGASRMEMENGKWKKWKIEMGMAKIGKWRRAGNGEEQAMAKSRKWRRAKWRRAGKAESRKAKSRKGRRDQSGKT